MLKYSLIELLGENCLIDIKEKKLKSYKFIDLFSGLGGFHLALRSFGAKCVFASDIDEQVIKVYEDNFETKVTRDITKVSAEDIPVHDIICAGFPCQPFSISGLKNGFDDPNGKLYEHIIRIAQYHKPKFIILENVRNLENHKKGETLKIIKESFESIGYSFFHKVLNASDFGIPQARKRIYMVCFKNELNIKDFSFPNALNKKTAVKDILEDINRESLEVKRNDIFFKSTENIVKEGALIRIGNIGLGRQGERIYAIDGHSSTLSSQGGGVGGKTGMYLINNKITKLSGRECARLMGFPDTYKITESLNANYTQFGNSVVVNVLQEIVKKIIETLGENL